MGAVLTRGLKGGVLLLLALALLVTAARTQTADSVGLSPTLAAIKKDRVVRIGYREA